MRNTFNLLNQPIYYKAKTKGKLILLPLITSSLILNWINKLIDYSYSYYKVTINKLVVKLDHTKSKILLNTLGILVICVSVNAQTQIGQDINSEGMFDESGTAVSINGDGSIIAIGAPFNGIGGHVRIYQDINSSWIQVGQDINGEALGDQSGTSVSLNNNGDIVAIGAPFNDANNNASGQVRVYQNISGVWTQLGQDIDGESLGDLLGTSVSLSDDGLTLAIGVARDDGNGTDSGQVKVFNFVSNAWTQIGQDINGSVATDYFGQSISLNANGTVLAVGAPRNQDNGFNSGYVRVYQNVSGNWIQTGQDIQGNVAGDYLGASVSLSEDGTKLAIGASGSNADRGYTKVYENISGNWVQIGQQIDGETAIDIFGSSVSLNANGNILAVGAPLNDNNGINSGHAKVYQYISGTWIQLGIDIYGRSSSSSNNRFGSSLSLNNNGTTLVIGAPGDGLISSYTRVFDLSAILNIEDVEIKNSFITLYPNPAIDQLTIESGFNNIKKITIFDTNGKLIKSYDNKNNISIMGIQSGLYYIQITTSKGNVIKKLLIE